MAVCWTRIEERPRRALVGIAGSGERVMMEGQAGDRKGLMVAAALALLNVEYWRLYVEG